MINVVRILIQSALRICMSFVEVLFWRREDWISVCSVPDYDDNVKCLIKVATGRGYRVWIFIDDFKRPVPCWAKRCVIKKRSITGMIVYIRSRCVIYTHGLYSVLPLSDRRTVVNIWHGMPIKKIGLLDSKTHVNVPKFHYCIASNDFYRDVIAKSFGVSEDCVLLLDAPRIDVLISGKSTAMKLENNKRYGVWMPTYRSCVFGDVRVDGDVNLDVLGGNIDLAGLDDLFTEMNIVCFLKPHPLSTVHGSRQKLNSIRLISEEWLLDNELTNYELLSNSQFLITDISSVYFDFANCGRPIFIFYPDLCFYSESRGYVAPLDELIHEKICTNMDELMLEIDMVAKVSGFNFSYSDSCDGKYRNTEHLLDAIGLVSVNSISHRIDNDGGGAGV